LGNTYVAFENQALNSSQAFASAMKMSFGEAMVELDKLDNEFTFGMTLDNSEFMLRLVKSMEAANYSTTQINKVLEQIGWSGELKYEYDDNGIRHLVGLESVH
jgi:hypothetical protein